ncbi:MAG: hypothetical protein DRJ50_09615 [Actinobacteria bacterium]|nr:MAG: hypothetical protein DRJ50_09615 [Actinomycetota bacterium]
MQANLLTGLILLTLLLLPSAFSSAEIVVDEETCTLIDAILAANTDSPSGGCPAGDGADTIVLTVDVTLREPYTTSFGGMGVPVPVNDELTIRGNFHTIRRADGAPQFRFMGAGSDEVRLEDLTLTNFSTAWDGGALFTPSSLILTRVTLAGNSAMNGGAIHSAGLVRLYSCIVTDNHAGLNGGGLSGENIELTGSTVSLNTAGNDGGGIFSQFSAVAAINSTVSGNSAGNDGGGIAAELSGRLRNSTVANNSAGGTGGGIRGGLLVEDSILAGNGAAGNCAFPLIPGSSDLGNNLSDDGTCGTGVGALTGLDLDLADNGGMTPTHALLPDSSAVDAAGTCYLETDQRGAPRNDGTCDSGAYEFQCFIEVSFGPIGTSIAYTPTTSAFDLVSGSISQLRADGDFSNASCVGSSFAGLALDPNPGPAPGEGRYYIGRGLDRCVGADYGDSSLDPDPRDALASAPCP